MGKGLFIVGCLGSLILGIVFFLQPKKQMDSPKDKELLEKLTPLQYDVTQQHGTERAFTGKYWDHKADGTYHCVVCDESLFDSQTKFKSGTGWPSFYDVIENGQVRSNDDYSAFMHRTEVSCENCGAHLGHVFRDGPQPTGLRYCVNSASLDFQPRTSDSSKNQ